MRVPYLLFHSHQSEDQWSLFALIHRQALNFSRIVTKALFTNYHRVQKKTSEVTETSYSPITENTHFVRPLIAYRNKSAALNSTFICLNRPYFSFLLDE